MALYECTFITRADMSKQDVTKVSEQMAAIITERGGKIVKEEYWGLRALAYKINKSGKGHYFFIGAEASADAISEITRQARINENIVRNLNIRVEAISKEQSPLLQRDRDDRHEAA
jgi:small subunit ribosomal protein S6